MQIIVSTIAMMAATLALIAQTSCTAAKPEDLLPADPLAIPPEAELWPPR